MAQFPDTITLKGHVGPITEIPARVFNRTIAVHQSIPSIRAKFTISDLYSGKSIAKTTEYREAISFAKAVCRWRVWGMAQGAVDCIGSVEREQIRQAMIKHLHYDPLKCSEVRQ